MNEEAGEYREGLDRGLGIALPRSQHQVSDARSRRVAPVCSRALTVARGARRRRHPTRLTASPDTSRRPCHRPRYTASLVTAPLSTPLPDPRLRTSRVCRARAPICTRADVLLDARRAGLEWIRLVPATSAGLRLAVLRCGPIGLFWKASDDWLVLAGLLLAIIWSSCRRTLKFWPS